MIVQSVTNQMFKVEIFKFRRTVMWMLQKSSMIRLKYINIIIILFLY
jgi:hypothetical protein